MPYIYIHEKTFVEYIICTYISKAPLWKGFEVLDNTKPKGIIKWTRGIIKKQSIPLNIRLDVFIEYETNIIHRNTPNDDINLFNINS